MTTSDAVMFLLLHCYHSKLRECQQPGEGLGFPFLNREKYGQLDAANDVPTTATRMRLIVDAQDFSCGVDVPGTSRGFGILGWRQSRGTPALHLTQTDNVSFEPPIGGTRLANRLPAIADRTGKTVKKFPLGASGTLVDATCAKSVTTSG